MLCNLSNRIWLQKLDLIGGTLNYSSIHFNKKGYILETRKITSHMQSGEPQQGGCKQNMRTMEIQFCTSDAIPTDSFNV